jgi:hypothetical protein
MFCHMDRPFLASKRISTPSMATRQGALRVGREGIQLLEQLLVVAELGRSDSKLHDQQYSTSTCGLFPLFRFLAGFCFEKGSWVPNKQVYVMSSRTELQVLAIWGNFEDTLVTDRQQRLWKLSSLFSWSHLRGSSETLYMIMRTLFQGLLFSLIGVATTVLGNTEKVIFKAPSKLSIPNRHPTLDSLQLTTLTPLEPFLQSRFKVSFPTEESPFGKDTWYLLRDLREHSRYEVRICWAASVSLRYSRDTNIILSRPHVSLAGFINEYSSSDAKQE